MEQWANYFIATAGAAAALTGLIFVAVSLNLKRILSVNHLPGRALGSLVLLANILFVSCFCLIPGESFLRLGGEVLVFGIIIWFIVGRMDIKMYIDVEKQYKKHYLQNLFFSQLAVLPYLAGGIFLIMKSTFGFQLIVLGITFSFIKSLVDSWVLLVEINR
jgi:hypothetical protein